MSAQKSKFSVLWRSAQAVDDLAQIARSLASEHQWGHADISRALQSHPVAPQPPQADAMASDACRAAAASKAAELSSEVAIVAVVTAKPPLVDVRLGTQTARLEMRQVASRSLLRDACIEHFLAAPSLPKRYDEWLTASLATAERVEAPHDSTDAEHEAWGVERCLRTLHRCESLAGTALHRAYVDEHGMAHISLPAVVADVIRPTMPGISTRRVTEIMRDLGWEPCKLRDGDTTVRLWRGRRGDVDTRLAADFTEIASLDTARRRREAERRSGGAEYDA